MKRSPAPITPKSKSKPIWITPSPSKVITSSIDWKDKAAHRARFIRARLSYGASLTESRQNPSPWPTAQTIRSSKEKLFDEPAPTFWQEPDPDAWELPSLSASLVEGRTRLTEFKLFTELPMELRLLIWGFAARLPRWMEVRHFKVPYDWPYIRCRDLGNLNMVCRESRDVAGKARKGNEVATLGMYRCNKEDKMTLRPLRFNPSRDTIFFRPLDSHNVHPYLWHDFSRHHTIQHIALPFGQDPKLNPLDILEEAAWRALLEKCVNLKSITFVLGSDEVSWRTWRGVEARRVLSCMGGKEEWKGLEWRGTRINVADLRGEAAALGAGVGGVWGFM